MGGGGVWGKYVRVNKDLKIRVTRRTKAYFTSKSWEVVYMKDVIQKREQIVAMIFKKKVTETT